MNLSGLARRDLAAAAPAAATHPAPTVAAKPPRPSAFAQVEPK